ncbi:MAG: hypothetical protein ACJAXK_001824 [Yoonia sp.]|jgi:hypothetical protein
MISLGGKKKIRMFESVIPATEKLPPIVTFIGIGAQKSATSWLHHALSFHPEIATSDPKELNYFTGKYDRGTAWYERHFADGTAAKAKGECSPTYFFSSDAAQRAYNYNPNLRLIAVLRDPTERAWSNHLHEIRKGHIAETTSFEQGMARNPTYVSQSRYKENLSRWIDIFGRDAMLVLLAEDIAVAPEVAFQSVCTHLGVDASFVPEGLAERRHESVGSRSKAVQKVLRSSGDFARRMKFGGLVRSLKSTKVTGRILALNRKDLRTAVTPMKEETRRGLVTTFQSDVDYVSDLLDRPMTCWKNWKPQNEEGGSGIS